MAVIPVSPLFLKDSVIDVAGSDYAAAVSSVAFTPTSPTVTFTGLKKDATFTDVGNTTWTVALTFAQDWDSANSLSRYLFTHAGETVSMTFRPKVGTGPSFTADVVIQPGAIGGAVGAATTATVTLGLNGAPKLVAATA
ncbi:hypothetical protein DOU02_06715 [Clavibacter michiganensis subsp. michiganensis]|uniref:hypothetical protein n=1 Tax=Clavibacter michiganensis TaxID=28447 RepID=UPI0013034536|nr:hypothetical protein [Clavibacter michiganensis]KAF0258770.1 hypothetical protein DOU02_06715 [Clavibacter michiganensis subsp. michiganensis]